jgi:hypothetical protein
MPNHRFRAELQDLAQSSLVGESVTDIRVESGQEGALLERLVGLGEFRIGLLQFSHQCLAVFSHRQQLIRLAELFGPASSCFDRFVNGLDDDFR